MVQVLCVGKNYPLHAKEMGSETPGEPIWFWKPASAILEPGGTIRFPRSIGQVDHEIELALRFGPDGRVDGVTLAIDVTARDQQAEAKAAGHPWSISKGRNTFLPLGKWTSPAGVDLQNLELELLVNGQVRQKGNTRDMTWTVEELIEKAREWTSFRSGDILLTGTPAGVGPLRDGDEVVIRIPGQMEFTFHVQAYDA